jgi:hypothetical protein
MKIKKYVRKPKSIEGLDVNKRELNELLKNNYPISVSEHDLNFLNETTNENSYIGTIMGDIENILNNKKDGDLWFVNKDFMNENYKPI